MKKIGELCKIDALGRVVIPIRIRRLFDIKSGDSLEILTDSDGIMLRKYIQSCVFCGNEEELTEKNGKCICADCIGYFKGTAEEK